MSLASEGSAWYRCKVCNAVFKLKHLMIRHLKTRHVLADRPEWELDNNDEKCATWWERVNVEGTTVIPIIKAKADDQNLNQDDPTLPPTFSLQELNSATSNNPGTLVLSEEAKKFKCDLCSVDLWFAFKKSLYAHLLKNHDRGLCKVPGLHLCRFCGFRAETPSHLKAHVRTHTGENEEDARLVECAARCGRVFSSKASMKKHVRFKCAEAKRLGLDDIIQQEGQGHHPFSGGIVAASGCGVGGEELNRSPRVPKTNPHVLRQSATDLPYKCPQCVETFPTHARLSGHLGVHSGDLYRCRYCSAPFAHVHTRGAHETNAHNDELGYGYRCPVCSKNFANIATIRGHYKYTHWLDLPPRDEIENWRIGASAAPPEQEVGVGIVIVEPHPPQQSIIPVHHQVQQQHQQQQHQPDFHSMMQQHHHDPHPPHQSQPHPTVQHQAQQPHHHQQHHPQQQQQQQQQHSSLNMSIGLRMPVGGGVSQITMGTLIGHMPAGQPQIPPTPPRAISSNKKVRKPRTPRTNKANKTASTSSSPRAPSIKKIPTKIPSSHPGKAGVAGKKKKNATKIERKKFHCRKPGCEGKFQRRWELTWHLERVHNEFSCEFCSIPAFHTKMEMVHHQYQIHHRELGCYECRLCGCGLESPRGVQQHVASEHSSTPVPLTLEAKMWRRGAIHRKRVQRPEVVSVPQG